MRFQDKPAARAWAKARLREVLPEERSAASASAARFALGEFAAGGYTKALVFLSMPREVDTAPLLDGLASLGASVAVPRISGPDLEFVRLDAAWGDWPRDGFGIPAPPETAPALGWRDLVPGCTVFVPGLLFDRGGGRLGRGKGFYDRFLSGLDLAARDLGAPRPPRWGYAYSWQTVEAVPAESHDLPMDAVITDAGALRPEI